MCLRASVTFRVRDCMCQIGNRESAIFKFAATHEDDSHPEKLPVAQRPKNTGIGRVVQNSDRGLQTIHDLPTGAGDREIQHLQVQQLSRRLSNQWRNPLRLRVPALLRDAGMAPSSLSQLNFRVESFELYPGIVG